MRSTRTPSPSGVQSPSKRSQLNSRAPTPTQSARAVTPSQSEFDMLPRSQSRPSSPAISARANTTSSRPRQPSISRLRPASPSQSSSSGTSRTRPSNAAQPTVPNGPSSGRQSPQRINGSAPPPPILDPAPPPRQRAASSAKIRTVSKTNNYTDDTSVRPDPLARISFFDPPNQAAIDRLILGGIEDADGEDGDVQATLANVEEMLEGYELASNDIIGRKTLGGAADLIEARLLDELLAMEKVSSHFSRR